jgi:hypothetical protein
LVTLAKKVHVKGTIWLPISNVERLAVEINMRVNSSFSISSGGVVRRTGCSDWYSTGVRIH